MLNAAGVVANETIYLNGSEAAASLEFNNAGSTQLLGGTPTLAGTNALTLTAGMTLDSGAGVVTIGDPTGVAPVNFVVNGSQSVANNSGSLADFCQWGELPAVTLAVAHVDRFRHRHGRGDFLSSVTNGNSILGLTFNAPNSTTTLAAIDTYTGPTLHIAGAVTLSGTVGFSSPTIYGGAFTETGAGSIGGSLVTGTGMSLQVYGGSATLARTPISCGRRLRGAR